MHEEAHQAARAVSALWCPPDSGCLRFGLVRVFSGVARARARVSVCVCVKLGRAEASFECVR